MEFLAPEFISLSGICAKERGLTLLAGRALPEEKGGCLELETQDWLVLTLNNKPHKFINNGNTYHSTVIWLFTVYREKPVGLQL